MRPLVLPLLTLLLVGCGGDAQERPTDPEPRDETLPRKPFSPENCYAAAVEIVQTQQVERYDEALGLLTRVPADHELRPDADAYTDWIGADRLVRDAQAAFREGRVAAALKGLDEAGAYDVLGQEARNSLRIRRHRWLTQVRACRAGLTALAADDAAAAREAFAKAEAGGDSPALADLAQAHVTELDGGPAPSPAVRALGERVLALDEALVAPPTADHDEAGWSTDWGDAWENGGQPGDGASPADGPTDEGWSDDDWSEEWSDGSGDDSER